MAEPASWFLPWSIVRSVLENLNSPHLQKIGLTQSARNDLEDLKTTLSKIEAVLPAAEKQQVEDPALRCWLRALNDAVNDAENIVDDVVAKNKVRVLNFLSYLMGEKIKKIVKRLEDIAVGMSEFGFRDVGVEEAYSPFSSSSSPSSLDREEKVFGRERDREFLIYLLTFCSRGENKVQVISILGTPGIGKTTLAHYVCKDPRIQSHFNRIIWEPVSEDFNANTIIEKVIERATGNKHSIQELSKSKFLLVLDDVRHENPEDWDKLRNLLKHGDAGSKILLTTHMEMVARNASTLPVYKLSQLSDYECWSLFKKCAFREEEEVYRKQAIGMRIVKKCGGLPLAAKTLGNQLCSKTEEREWLSIFDSETLDLTQEMGILRLSYDPLPSTLKLCFNYCSLFPKDYEIDKKNLIQLWVAEGFILPKQGQCLEDIGNEHFDKLMSKFFFEDAKKDEYGNITTCKMNFRLYDLAQSVARRDCSIVHVGRRNFSKVDDISERIRHISFVPLSSPLEVPKVSLLKARKVRTILLPLGVWPRSMSTCDDIFSRFRYLRVLDLNNSSIEKLPSSIGELKHLRYLDLSWNNMKRLPNSISQLWSLQTLKLLYCYSLEELPRDIGKMVNLRHIELSNRVDFTHMPIGLRNLNSLQTLSAFVVGRDIGCGLSELDGIDLRGNLSILYLENMRNAEHAKGANLKDKQNLRVLELIWNKEDDDGANNISRDCVPEDVLDGLQPHGPPPNLIKEDDGGNNILRDSDPEDVLEGLQPHPNLKGLHIEGYGGFKFSDWMMDYSFLRNIVKISLHKCTRSIHLPPFGKLPYLKFLILSRLDAVEYFGSGSVVGGFPSLKQLVLRGMLNLTKWSRDDATEKLLSFPHLSKLTLTDCPKLTTIPLHPSLEKLMLENCSEELFQSMSMMSYMSMTVENPATASSSLSSSSFKLSNLKSLEIRRCKDLGSLPENGFQNLLSLEHLEIIECPRLKCLPEGIICLASLKFLRVEWCDFSDLPKDIQKLASLRELYLSRCPNLKSLPKGIQHLTTLAKLSISQCPKLLTCEDWPKIAHIQEIIVDDKRVHTIRG